MTRFRLVRMVGSALATGAAASLLIVGGALAHPESEGDHPAGCVVTVEPGTVAAGGQFTVSGNFGGASIFLVEGVDAAPAEDAEPAATTPEGGSFSVTFTAEDDDIGEWTVWGMIMGSECGDSDSLTVGARLPNAAVAAPAVTPVAALVAILAMLALAASRLTSR